MSPDLLGVLLPLLAAGVCLLLFLRVITVFLKLVFFALLVLILVQIAATYLKEVHQGPTRVAQSASVEIHGLPSSAR